MSEESQPKAKKVARAQRGEPPTPAMIATAGRIIPRPSHKSLAETFQRAVEGVFSEEEIATAYRGLMQAERVYLDRNGRELRTPDFQIRAAVLRDYLDRTIGRPVERQQVMTFEQPASFETILERMTASPVLRKTLMGMLQDAEAKEAGQ